MIRVSLLFLLMGYVSANAQTMPVLVLASPQVAGDRVLLSWTASTSPGVSYNALRSTAAGGPYTPLNPTPINGAVTYTDTTVQPGQTYYYVVRAVLNGIESSNSNQVMAVIQAVPQAPALAISTASLPVGTVGVTYPVIQFGITGGTPPYACYGTGSTIPIDPAWTLFVNTNCSYGGVPSQPGSFTIHLNVHDSAGAIVVKSLSLTIDGVQPPPVPVPSVKYVTGDTFRVVTSGGRLNVRSAPSMTATVVTTMQNNSTERITGGPVKAGVVTFWQMSKGWFSEAFARQ